MLFNSRYSDDIFVDMLINFKHLVASMNAKGDTIPASRLVAGHTVLIKLILVHMMSFTRIKESFFKNRFKPLELVEPMLGHLFTLHMELCQLQWKSEDEPNVYLNIIFLLLLI